jgi:subtilase family serine protease
LLVGRVLSAPFAQRKLLALVMLSVLLLPVVTTLPVGAAPSVSAITPPPLHGFRPLGPAPSDLPILVTLALPLRNVVALDSLVAQISDPASPMYRHFLTAEQVRSEFLPTAAFD